MKDNLTWKQKRALNELKNNKEIIIKEADKGSAVVIMSKHFYKSKILEILNDSNNYEKTSKNFDKDTMKNIHVLCQKFNDHLTEKEIDYVTKFEYRTSNFYGLPKIHKSKLLKDAIVDQNSAIIQLYCPNDLTFRPIVAGPVCPTHRLSNMIDILLQPFMTKIASYIKDDFHFLNFVPDEIPEDSLLCTFDVVSLYSNIPHSLGIEAITYWIEKYPGVIPHRIPKDFIIDSIRLILNNNYFQFGDLNFKQINGTAMGTKMAPTYATLTLAFLENKLYNEIEFKFDSTVKAVFVKSWKRYLDDCFIIWNNAWGNINVLFNILQCLHKDIKFTMHCSETELPFLDILVIKSKDKLLTDIYYKATDTKQYLHFKSSHPRNCKLNIPYNLARRICTIVKTPDLRTKRLNELFACLTSRGYPHKLIEHGIRKAEGIPIHVLRNCEKQKDTADTLAYVSTFNPRHPEIFNLIYNNIPILKCSVKMNNVMKDVKLIKSKRQPRNLKKILTQAKFEDSESTPQISKCNRPRCKICPIIIQGEKIHFSATDEDFIVKSNLTCESRNVVYVLNCSNCNDQYIGSTKNFANRVTLHRSQIRNECYRNLEVSKHIHTCGKNNFRISPFYQCSNESQLLIKENYFISKYKPSLNR